MLLGKYTHFLRRADLWSTCAKEILKKSGIIAKRDDTALLIEMCR